MIAIAHLCLLGTVSTDATRPLAYSSHTAGVRGRAMGNSTTLSTTVSAFGVSASRGLTDSDETDNDNTGTGPMRLPLYENISGKRLQADMHSGEKPKWPRVLHPNCPQPTEGWGGREAGEGGVQKGNQLGLAF